MEGVVADKVDRQKSRHRAIGIFGQIDQQSGLGGCLIAGESDEHLAPDRLAAERGSVILDDLELESARAFRAAAVYVFAKKFKHLRASFLHPILRRFNPGAVLHRERVGEFVPGHFGLVVVCGGQGGVAHGESDQGGDSQRQPASRSEVCHARYPSQAVVKKQERSDNLGLPGLAKRGRVPT